MSGAAGLGPADRFLRRALAAGAQPLKANHPIVTTTIDQLEVVSLLGPERFCEHLLDRVKAGAPDLGYAFVSIAADHVRCPDCRTEPDRTKGCGFCGRPAGPGLQHVVHVHPRHQLVIEGLACRQCRQGGRTA